MLKLSLRLLDALVGNKELREFAPKHNAEAVVVGKVAVVVGGEVDGGCCIRVILHYRRVQVPVGQRAVGAEAQRVLSPPVLRKHVGAACAKASAAEHRLPVPTASIL